MKTKNTLNNVLLVAILLLSLASCKKGDIKMPGTGCSSCRIDAMDIINNSGNAEHYQFIYNSDGNPVKTVGTYGQPDLGTYNYIYHFRYNKQGQLTDFFENTFPSGGLESIIAWHRYTYEGKETVTDSAWYYAGLYSDNLASPQLTNDLRISVHKLDKSGRIIKTTRGNYVYDYNAQGNLVGRTYDNKTNIHLTNKVWQFIFNDFSVNNGVTDSTLESTITSYNQYGLPLTYKANLLRGGIFGYDFQTLSVIYSCDDKKGGAK